ncbi:MAG: Mut7-C ubiquitin/RNAse domain-containing protein [Deltaproteobacteria bacterium]|nr:Mut7-C ubiquitin/RNAse domain-containing protein [Deltaproteobacteria bacterium]MBW2048691.1 Mut7-C ubiquitin/RNAse domain-containing protein [Deltaproteobacteria bacterium]MBW2111079.1 Mut7-C ubiquitin/RNAse domain-containing protein [Deltaproteobacteria bacterium]MBW2353501.1 Mut7-C ubiquitin/RNAse domain-containing protein [Deltaproteobacteria bacterium]
MTEGQKHAVFRFYEELNDLLPPEHRKRDFQVSFKGRESVKDMIEALRVPHTEVDLILVNGESVDFGYIVEDRDRISVYPAFEFLNIKGLTRLRQVPLRQTRFIADVNIGDVVRYMRALGLDVYFDRSLSPRDIIRISRLENRTILSRSRKLLMFRDVTHGILIRPGTTIQQVKSVVDYLSLRDVIKPFSRCFLCNNLLARVAKEKILDRIPPKTREFCDEYSHCGICDRIYWKGTHHAAISRVLDQILG